MSVAGRATLDDLMRTEGRAELVDGGIVRYTPMGHAPAIAVGNIVASLHDYAKAIGRGWACTSTMGYAIPELPSGRESFSPSASYYDGPLPDDPRDFLPGPPTFAVEMRSTDDYGATAEVEMAAKRADYFEAGTRVVWDVDPDAGCVRVYRADAPDHPTVYHKGQAAEAEPALPGWRLAVEAIFA